MRCTRCDQLAIPQALGRTPEGRLVFGWCLTCLADVGCQEIEIADPPRLRPLISLLATSSAAQSSRVVRLIEPSSVTVGNPRRKVLAVIAVALALWGVVLLVGGLVAQSRPMPISPSPMGNGSPALLLVGGAIMTIFGALLWLLTPGRAALSPPQWLKRA